MRRILLSLVLTISLSLLVIVSCTKEPIAGVESSVSETGQVQRVKITADQCNIRNGVSDNTEVIKTTNKNSKLDVVNQVGDWYAVKLDDNNIGFVPANQCTPVIAEDKPANVTSTGEDATPSTGSTPNSPDTKTQTPNAVNNNNPSATSASLTADEQEMLNLVNQARVQNNLPELKIDMEVTNVARIKSQDMIDNNYFSHNSPTYGSPFDMMKDFGISYVKAGENIAGNQTVAAAHEALMNSPGHRENFLSPDYTHIGIGIVDGGQYGKMFTQQFVSKPQ